MIKSRFVRLLLERRENGDTVSIAMQRVNAEYFGWTEAFPEWTATPRWVNGRPVGRIGKSRCGRNGSRGGQRLYICRHPSKMGYPAGMTHCFRVIGKATDMNLARLAAATKREWTWMETRYGERRSRDQWLAIYNGVDEMGAAVFRVKRACALNPETAAPIDIPQVVTEAVHVLR